MLFNLVLTPQHSTISFKVQKHTVLSSMEYLRPVHSSVDLNYMAPTKYQVSLLIFVK